MHMTEKLMLFDGVHQEDFLLQAVLTENLNFGKCQEVTSCTTHFELELFLNMYSIVLSM